MAQSCQTDYVDFAAHSILRHRWLVPNNDLSKILVPKLWGVEFGTREEREMVEEEDYSFADKTRGWSQVDIACPEKGWRLGRNNRLLSDVTLIKGRFFVHFVNESSSELSGDHDWAIIGVEKNNIEAFFVDFGDILEELRVRPGSQVAQWSGSPSSSRRLPAI
jgi:hypothetical protein